jgi:hypothetical protein
MYYGQMCELYANKVKGYDAAMCAFALADCHSTLAINKHLPTDDPYYIKLWAEIDALRDRQMKLGKVPTPVAL